MIKAFEKPIYVTRPFLPPLEKFYDGLKEIWDSHWLTNNGPIVQRFCRQLSNYFETNNVCLFNNGTLALQIGLEGMGIAGEVITTPFTFVATTHALFWNKIRPVYYLKNFGFKNEVEVVMPGTNAKMNEMQALMGSMILGYLDGLIEKRRKITEIYRQRLNDIPGIKLPPSLPADVKYNHAYMVIEVHEKEFGMSRDKLYEELKKYNIHTRRYFYPLICDFPCYRSVYVKDPLTVARLVASTILNLPIYYDLQLEDVHRICNIIIELSSKESNRQNTKLVAEL